MQDRIINFVSENSGISADRFRELMTATGGMVTDVGTLLDGAEAVKEGVINEVGGLRDAMKKLRSLIKERKNKDVSLLDNV